MNYMTNIPDTFMTWGLYLVFSGVQVITNFTWRVGHTGLLKSSVFFLWITMWNQKQTVLFWVRIF